VYTLEKVKNEIVKKINKALGKKIVQASDLVYPPNPEMGDLSLACFKNNIKLGSIAAKDIKTKVVLGVKWVGSYLNFTINKEYLAEEALKEIRRQKDKYGKNNSGKNKKVMIEYSNANTHKEYHVGHLRNICYGDAVNRIISVNGFKSIPVSYINDFGIHVAKTLWNYILDKKNWDKIFKHEKGRKLGDVYVDACIREKKDKLAKKKIEFIMKKIETRKGEEYDLWEETRKWSIDYFQKIYDELGVKFNYTYYENEFVGKGLKKVDELLKKKVLKKSQGAIIADLEKYGLNVLVFKRSDGTATYPVADLALAEEKFKKCDTSIYVIDVRQSLYFKQLFKVLELMGYKKDMVHLGYEFVKLPSGMMSSREGNVVTYEKLSQEVFKRVKKETKLRHKNWTAKQVDEVARVIGIGAMKFEMIKVGAGNVITFDIKKALEFSGYTAAYLQYTYARIQSIVSKARNAKRITQANYEKLTNSKEHGLVLGLAKYPEVVLKAGEKYDPSEIAKYLFELAQEFNDYYHQVPVLKAEKEVRDARLVLITSVSQVIKNGLGLLGIKVVDKM